MGNVHKTTIIIRYKWIDIVGLSRVKHIGENMLYIYIHWILTMLISDTIHYIHLQNLLS